MMSPMRAVSSVPRFLFRAAFGSVLPSVFLFGLSVQAQDPGADAAMQAQQATQMAAQAAQQASQQAMQDAQQANQAAVQQAMANASSMPTRPVVIRPPWPVYARADKPQFSPAPGKFSSPTRVAIQDSTPGAVFFYTLDGSTPTASSAAYTGPILVSSTTKLRAIACSQTKALSGVTSAKYVIK